MALTWRTYVPGLAVLMALLVHWSGFTKTEQEKLDVAKLAKNIGSSDLAEQHRAVVLSVGLASVPEFMMQMKAGGLPIAVVQQIKDHPLKDKERISILTALILSAARLAEKDLAVQKAMVAAGILPRMIAIVGLGYPLWTAAAGELLSSLSIPPSPQDEGDLEAWEAVDSDEDLEVVAKKVESVVKKNGKLLLSASLDLLEKGAHSNSTDAVVSASRLLGLILHSEVIPPQELLSTLPMHLMLQLLATHAGEGHALMGAVMQLLDSVCTLQPHLVPQQMQETGAIKYVLSELRTSKNESLHPGLKLVRGLSSDLTAAEELISGGVLTMCTQVLFSEAALEKWKLTCAGIVSDLAHLVLNSPSVVSSAGTGGVGWTHFEPLPGSDAINTRESLEALLEIIRLAHREPALQNAAISALRDVGRYPLAAATIADLGGIPALLDVIGNNATASTEQKAWLLSTQRNTGMLLALLALQPLVRNIMVEEGAIEALAGCMEANMWNQGMAQQVRITAAAAMVPILSPDPIHLERAAISATLLESLVTMYFSKTASEAAVASRVLSLMKGHSEMKALFEKTGVDV